MFKYPKPGSKRNRPAPHPVNVLQGWKYIREAVHRAQHCSGMSSTISSERLRAMTQKSHFILLAILPSNSATPWLKLKHHCSPGCHHSQRNQRLKGWRKGVRPKMNLEQQGQHSPTKLQTGEKCTLLGMKPRQCSREQPWSASSPTAHLSCNSDA